MRFDLACSEELCIHNKEGICQELCATQEGMENEDGKDCEGYWEEEIGN